MKVWATDVPQGFEVVEVFSSLESPAGFAFSPDGRMFICERINGKLLVAEFNASSGQWELTPTPFYTFETPNEGGNPVRVRSAGLRDIAFDPDFATNGYIYAFYMENTTRQNRVVRIQTSASNPNRAEGGSEVLLLEVPYNGDASSGSHNGGAIEFGPDGRLYITTGDGWNGGDVVQSLTTFTGKVFRINKDGSIPTDNPFYNQTTGKYRAIYGLGLRNPYSMSSHPETGQLYINEAGGGNKASIYLVEPGANYGHQGYTGIGSQRSEWANGSGDAGGNLITGGAWYPSNGYWPSTYHGVYFTALWGNNGQSTGRINYVQSQTQTTVTPFGTQVGQSGLKPVLTRIGPDENLYYMLTDYESGSGRVQMVRWSGQASAATPSISPNGGSFNDPVSVTLSSTTGGAEIRYTLDGTTPNESSPLYTGPVTVSSSSVLNARAYGNDLAPSSVSSATFTIGQVSNIPPVAEAGSDQYATPNTLVTISGAGSYDPDGDDLTLSWHWEQVSGPTVELFSSEDAVAFFTPTQEGTYQFELTVIDAQSESSDVMSVIVANELPLDAGLVGYWALDETGGSTARDETGSHDGTLSNGPAWSPDEGQVGGALLFDGSDDYVDIGGIDIGGSSGMTLAFWFKADDFGVHDARFVSKATGDQEQDHYWMVSTINETALRFRLKTGGTTTTLISSGNVIRAGTWYHVAAVYDGSQMQIVLDGAVIASTQKSGTVNTDGNAGVALGNQPGGEGGRSFDGLLDDVRIYNRPLSPASINALSDSGDTGSGVVFGDATGNGEVSALDASLILQHIVGLVSLDEGQLAAADVSGESGVSALDASLILRYVAGLISCFPAEQGCGAAKQLASSHDDIVLEWGAVQQGTAIDQHTVGLQVVQGSGALNGLTMTLTYDPDHVRITDVGTYLPSDWQVAYRVDEQAGVLYVSMAGVNPVASEELVSLRFYHTESADYLFSTVVQVNEASFQTIEAFSIGAAPTGFSLEANYPNPFTTASSIRYHIAEPGLVQLEVFDVSGRSVALLANEVKAAGVYESHFDAKFLPSGMYFYRLTAGSYIQTRSMLLLK